jgi:transcriptional regulator with GAF, ATPase, and Fis domain
MRRHIEAALHVAHGRVEGPHGAARMLRINPHTLRARMRKLKIDWRGFRSR